MAETPRELVVTLSLDSRNFSRNMRTINQQIKEAESTFRLAGTGTQNHEKTIAGTGRRQTEPGAVPGRICGNDRRGHQAGSLPEGK